MRFLVLLCVVNTVLFTAAKLMNISLWYAVAGGVLAVFGWVAISAWFSPAQQLVKQASHMGWVHVGTLRDEQGYRDSVLEREGAVARVSFVKKYVFLVEPPVSSPFKDFVEVERALLTAEDGRNPATRNSPSP